MAGGDRTKASRADTLELEISERLRNFRLTWDKDSRHATTTTTVTATDKAAEFKSQENLTHPYSIHNSRKEPAQASRSTSTTSRLLSTHKNNNRYEAKLSQVNDKSRLVATDTDHGASQPRQNRLVESPKTRLIREVGFKQGSAGTSSIQQHRLDSNHILNRVDERSRLYMSPQVGQQHYQGYNQYTYPGNYRYESFESRQKSISDHWNYGLKKAYARFYPGVEPPPMRAPDGSIVMPRLTQYRAPPHIRTTLTKAYDIEMASKQTRIENLPPAERKKQEEWAQAQIRLHGSCPEHYLWNRIRDGYQCQGGNHLISDELLAEGKRGIFLFGGAMQSPPYGPYYPDSDGIYHYAGPTNFIPQPSQMYIPRDKQQLYTEKYVRPYYGIKGPPPGYVHPSAEEEERRRWLRNTMQRRR